jgi:hypothetical protein
MPVEWGRAKIRTRRTGSGSGNRSALIGVGGVVFGVFLTTAIEARSRRKIATEQALGWEAEVGSCTKQGSVDMSPVGQAGEPS